MHGLLALLHARLLSFSLILAIGFLLVVSLVASAALSSLGRWWGPAFQGWVVLAVVINAAVAFLLVATLWVYANTFGSRRTTGDRHLPVQPPPVQRLCP